MTGRNHGSAPGPLGMVRGAVDHAARVSQDNLPPMAAGRGTPALGGTREDAIETLARTLWGEARGEPVRGIEAVAAVVLNRVAVARRQGGFWWGNSIVEVCRKPWQFSCWNPDDVNRPKMLAVKTGEPMFDVCLRVARRAVAGLIADPTLGATHYHHRSVHPEWAKGRAPSAVIGVHLFYNDAG